VSVPTRIDFNDFQKAVEKIAILKGYRECKITRASGGSAVRFEIFRNDEVVPHKMWTAHEDRHERKVYTQDLKKACDNLGVSKKSFERYVDSKFKKFEDS